jgi:hypothetical protein
VTGCGCLILIGVLVGGILFMIFGSTDPGEPIAQSGALLVAIALVLRMTLVPIRRGLVRARRA